MITRRRFATGAGAAAFGYGWCDGAVLPAVAAGGLTGLEAEFARIETASGGRLGVAVVDTHTGEQAGHRADERFPLGSTFKLLAAAAVLARVDAGREQLDRRIHFRAGELVAYSPVTKDRAGEVGATLEELCEAAMAVSDNTAGNLLLHTLGGPAGLTAFVRSLGDTLTRLDRIEPDLNEATPGDPRDTTSPKAMVSNLRALALADRLSPRSRDRLVGWLLGCRTGEHRLRAGLPPAWRVGDKTGSGGRGTTNDVAILWPPARAPLVIAAYLTGTAAPLEQREATLAAVGRAIAAALAP